MKVPFIISALASLLVLYSHSSFSAQAQSNNIFVDDKNHKLEDGVKAEKEGIDNIMKAPLYSSFNNFAKKGGRLKFSSDVMFYIWNSTNDAKEKRGKNDRFAVANLDFNFHCDLGKNCESMDFEQDSIISVGIESNQDKYGNVYGVNWVSHINNRDFTNRESKVFVKTPYGDFSLGYQEGVESYMRLDASNIVVGETRNNWVKHLRGLAPGLGSLRSGSYFIYNFIFHPGLYTESVVYNYCNLASNDLLTCTIDLANMESLHMFYDYMYSVTDIRDFGNSISHFQKSMLPLYTKLVPRLPFKLSYQSQNFMGFKFGISYAPFSYNKYSLIMNLLNMHVMSLYSDDFLKGFTPEGRIRLKNGMAIYMLEPMYKQIISGGISYAYNMDNIKFNASVVGEYGRGMSVREYVGMNELDNESNLKYNDLQGIAIGLGIDYGKIKVVGAYGYLGKSGFYTPRCDMTSDVDACEKYNAYTGSGVIDEHNVAIVSVGTPKYENYYWNIGISYQYKSLDLSMTYFKSNRMGHILQDINIGLEYSLLKYSGFKGSLFGNFHHYIFDQVKYLNQPDHIDVRGKGNVLLVGIKLKF